MTVKHRKREEIFPEAALLISVKLNRELPSLRERQCLAVIHLSLNAAKERFGMRVLEFAVLGNHLHYIVQVEDNEALSRGMQGLLIRTAKALNKLWGRKGKVFAERFHSSLLKHRWALIRAIRYVLQNGRKHGIRLPADRPDPYTSGPWFKGWKEQYGTPFDSSEPPVSPMVWNIYCMQEAHRQICISLTELPGPRPDGLTRLL